LSRCKSAQNYNANSGAAINANLITGLNAPSGLAATGNLLFVSNEIGGTVDKYTISGDSKTAQFNLSIPSKGGPVLFVANAFGGTVSQCDTVQGTVVNANFIPGLNGLAGLAMKNATK
jgi:hypothetical protein